MRRLHELVPYGLSLAGIGLALQAPWPGVALVTAALAYSGLRHVVSAEDAERAREVVSGLSHVVNANAQRLEDALARLQRAESDLALMQGQRLR